MNNTISLFLTIVVLFSCAKEKAPKPTTPEKPYISKWEEIPGKYNVYDTTGTFLYEMELIHKLGMDSLGKPVDSLQFINFGGHFNFTWQEMEANSIYSNVSKNYFYIGTHLPIKDKFDNRWRILGLTEEKYNCLIDDTIKIRYDKCNILYYIEDNTPYFCEVVKEIAVKQH